MIVVEIENKSLACERSMWLDCMMPRWLTNAVYAFLIIVPKAQSHYLHLRHFALTLVAVVLVDFVLLQYAYISFFCLLAGLATLHLVYIILANKCARECPELFPDHRARTVRRNIRYHLHWRKWTEKPLHQVEYHSASENGMCTGNA